MNRLRQPTDVHAIRIPERSGLPPCLYIPLAARNKNAIETYVGRIVSQLSLTTVDAALLVETHEPVQPDNRLGIWSVPGVEVLHSPVQVWVHVDSRGYRGAYVRAFPETDLTGLVLDHVLNRRVARLKDFAYLRIVPISRGANSSHGALSEAWSVKHHSSQEMREKTDCLKRAYSMAIWRTS